MKTKIFWLVISALILLSMILMSCTSSSTTSTSEATSTSKPPIQTSTSAPPPPPVSTTTSSPPPSEANWWDKFGEPNYGGELACRTPDMDPSFDSVTFLGRSEEWYEQLFEPDWTLDRNVWSFQFGNFVPEEYMVGCLADTWNWTDSKTLAFNIHKGILWHNMPPVNGREFTADDIVFTFDRLMGTGHGYTEVNESYARFLEPIEKVTLTGTYSFTIKFKKATPWTNMRAIYESIIQPYEAPEVVALGPHANDPKTAIGTGPYMFKELIRNSSMTMIANPDYWKYDERYPKNKLPYIETMKEIVIGDDATATAAFRTGKLDFMGQQALLSKQLIEKTNPEVVIYATPYSAAGAAMRVDLPPFNDIRVRKAMQLAIDIPSIAKDYYAGSVPSEPCGDINPGETGYCYPYTDWPQSLKDEYTYNPTKAKELLAEAGYSNGLITDMVYSTAQTDVAFLEILKAMFMDIDVDVELKPMDFVSFMDFTHAGKAEGLTGGSVGGTGPPQIAISTRTKGAMGNASFVDDPIINDLNDQINNATSSDEAKRICQEFDKYVVSQHYSAIGPAGVTYAFWQPYLKGFSGEVGPGRNGARVLAPFFYAARVWIDQDLKKSMGR